MQWLQTVDTSLFHLVNPAWNSPLLDVVMPFFSGNILFAPAVLVAAIALIWKGGARGRLCVAMILLAVAFGDGVVCHTLKDAIHRPRPFLAMATSDVHVPSSIGKTDSGSMPSSHAANWFAATMVAFIYYRRSIRFMLPFALLVGFSRIYNGVHYPSDVLIGAILGAGYAAGLVWTADALWRWAGGRWFPIWHQRLPSLLDPVVVTPVSNENDKTLRDRQWMRLGYALILIQYIIYTAYIASGLITLSEDEAYQWIWSKHLALSYYSKPLLIALTQWLGTHIWGDTVFGVRFFAPVLGAITSLCLLRFMARVTNVRAAFWLTAIWPVVPLISVGATLMTVDPLSVMFFVLAMIAGWRAVQEDATTTDWLWVGLWMGLDFLSKYTNLFQLASFAMFFVLYPPARKQLRRPGPYLALLLNFIFSLPVVIWNLQHHGVTVTHIMQDGSLDKHWVPSPANLWHGFSNFTRDFVLQEFVLQNPFFFPVLIVTAIIFWRQKPRSPLLVYFFSMAAPNFLFYFLLTFHSRALANWIAPSIPPLFCLAVAYWEPRWRDGKQPLKFCLVGGFALGILMAVVLRNTNIVGKFTGGHVLPAAFDSTRRAKGWKETAELVENKREQLMKEGKPVFLICDHYGIAGEMTFNIPEAKAGVPDHPLVYFYSSPVPMNQFYFWPGYKDRKGQNALYLREVDFKRLTTSDVPKWLVDLVNKVVHWEPPSSDYIDYSIPPEVKAEFESVTDVGPVVSMHQGHPAHRIQIFECRGLK